MKPTSTPGTHPDNPKLRNVRIEIGQDARNYVTGEQRVTMVPLTIRRKHNRKVMTPPPGEQSVLGTFLGSLGLEHLGKRRVEIMIRSAQGELDTLEDWRSGKLRDPRMAELAGAPNIAAPIQDGIDAMAPVIDKMLTNGVEILPPQEDLHGSAESEGAQRPAVCISGKLPSGKKKADYQEPLLAAGYELVDDVSKELSYLVLADIESTSSKSTKAKKLGIRVIDEDELNLMIIKGRS